MTQVSGEASSSEAGRVWILSDQRGREAAYEAVVAGLQERGVDAELVSITEVIGTAAREALAGGAERLLRGLRVATRGHAGEEDFIGALRRARPDVLVLTSPRFARALSVIESLTGVGSVQVGLTHQPVAAPGWFTGSLHGFVVPDQRTADAFVAEGAVAERVHVAGPAVRPASLQAPERDNVRAELGLAEALVVLVRAEALDHATLEKIVFQCTLMDRPARVLFHHNGDGGVAATLRRAADHYGLPASMFGHVPDLEKYVAAADLVLAAGDDPYLPEALAVGTPPLLVSVGEDAGVQAEALHARGLAGKVHDVLRLGSELDRFTEPERLRELRERLLETRDEDPNRAVVDALVEALQEREAWRRPLSSAEPEGGESAPVAGPFESIGRSGDQASYARPEAPAGGPAAAGPVEEAGPAEKGALVVPPPRREPVEARPTIGAAEAREQLAQLILSERDCERRLEELEKHQERWRGRLELAREWNERDLESEAETILRGYQSEAAPLVQELADIRRQKEKLKNAARGTTSSAGSEESGAPTGERANRLEERFQKMEVDRDLKGLKDRIKRELGE
ncbi:hypothetical protein DL240_03010 [Lujinxingia litoralis]|uniref:Diacylglycerol glucosyltransferase N-terminal domain-containing protein n=1 Tax=Lujinxingia litoralis TaxID=2211119 RepID=A0A328C9P8_9DELT|nr:hypothetical protein [Lujinxingia litoralis]RAL25195.1 hypothetical protein DL240_03010 [Lujinxingia litoralis]